MERGFLRNALVVLTATLMTLAGCATPARPDADSGAAGKPVVYASFYPIASVVDSVSGGAVEVRSFIPPGQDPHLWEPTPRDMRALADADLLVVNGANMEPWLDLVEDNLPDLEILVLSDYVELITYRGAAAIGEFEYLAEVPLEAGKEYKLRFGHTHEKSMRAAFFSDDGSSDVADLVARGREVMSDPGEGLQQNRHFDAASGRVQEIEMGHESGVATFTVPHDGHWYFVADRVSQEILSYWIEDAQGEKVTATPVVPGGSSTVDKITHDPHSWMSVINAKRYANAIHGTLSERFPAHEREFDRAKVQFVRKLTKLQAEYNEKFADARRKDFIVSHSAFAYLARDFGLTQRALQGLTTSEAPSLHSLVGAIRYVRDNDIEIVYYEYGTEDPGAHLVADEVDGTALPLASMELVSAADPQFETGYLGYLEMNLHNLHESMK